MFRQHQLSAAESVTNSRLAVDGLIVRPLLLVARLSVCAQRHSTYALQTFLRDVGDQPITEEFGEPLDFEREAVGTSNRRAVLFAIDREAVADQDLIGIDRRRRTVVDF